MGSKWRFNVWFYGDWLDGLRLCARRLPPHDDELLTNHPTIHFLSIRWLAPTVFGELPTFLTTFNNLNQDFPYGVAVESDH